MKEVKEMKQEHTWGFKRGYQWKPGDWDNGYWPETEDPSHPVWVSMSRVERQRAEHEAQQPEEHPQREITDPCVGDVKRG